MYKLKEKSTSNSLVFSVLFYLYHSLYITNDANIINHSNCDELNQLKKTSEINYEFSVRNEISIEVIDIWKNIYNQTFDRKDVVFDNSVDNTNDKSTYDHLSNL